MTTLASLRIILGLDSGGVKTGANSVRSDLKGVQAEANRTNATLRDIGKGVGAGLGIGAGLGAFQLASRGVLELTGFLSDSVKAAQDDELSIAKLTTSLKANVPAWDQNSAAIEKAVAAQTKFAFQDDDVRASLTTLVAATHDVNRALAIQNTAMDLARFKGISLQEATTALIKVEGGRYRALIDLGIQLKAGASQEQALAAVQATTAGQREAFLKTSAGAAEEAGVAFKEAQEAIGKGLTPVVVELSHFSRDVLAPALTIVGDNMGTILPIAEGLAAVFGARLVLGLTGSAIGFVANTAAAIANSVVVGVLTGEVVALAVAEDAEAVSAGTAAAAESALWIARAGPAAIVVAGVVAVGAAALHTAEAIQAEGEAAKTTGEHVRQYDEQMARLKANLDAGLVTQDQYNTAVAATKVRFGDVAVAAAGLGTAVTGMTPAFVAQAIAMAEGNRQAATAVAAASVLSPAQLRVAEATIAAAAAHKDLAEATSAAAAASAGDTSAVTTLAIAQEADRKATADLKAAQDAATQSLDLFDQKYKDVQANLLKHSGTDALSDALLEIQNEATKAALDLAIAADAADLLLSKQLKSRGEVPRLIGDVPTGTTTGTPGEGVIATLQAIQSYQDSLNRHTTATGGATSGLATAYKDKLGAALDVAKTKAHTFFDALHQHNLDAIRDIHDTANAALDEQERAIRGVVSGERARVDAIRTHRQGEALKSSITAATSPEELARAQQAYNDFLDDQRLAFLSASADTQVAALEAEKAKNDSVAALAKAAEDTRYKDQVAAYDKDLAALHDYLGKVVIEWGRAAADIAKLTKKYGVSTIIGNLAPAMPPPPAPPPAPKAAPLAVVAAGLAPMGDYVGGGKIGDVYLDGEKVGQIIERRQYNLAAIYNPAPPSPSGPQ